MMTHDEEDRLAKQLEFLHQRLKNQSPHAEPPDGDGGAVQGYVDILELIERVRRHNDSTEGEHANPGTLRCDADNTTAGQNTAGNTDWLSHQLDRLLAQTPLEDACEIATPRSIGRFRIDGLLGRGGFGVVFRAFDPQLDRPVALKVPRPDAFSPDGRRRFLREARAAGLLGHPNIVTVYEAGQIGGLLYAAYQLIDGPTLHEWLMQDPGRLAPLDAARVIGSLASAIHHAHERGIIHRDLKPSNILLAMGDARDVPSHRLIGALRITDFGLARMDQPNELSVTHSGAMLGTPGYMSPEQIRGGQATSDPAVDIYALGAILYELLTGTPPFRKPTLLATLKAIEEDEPIAPRRLRGEIPRDLEAICLKCLEKQPSQRYATAHALEADIDRWCRGLPITARSITARERFVRWCLRNPALSSALAGIGIALVAGLTATSWQWWRTRVEWQRAERNFAEANQQRNRAERHLEHAEYAIDQMLNQVGDSFVGIPQLERLQEKFYRQALQLQQSLLADEPADPNSKLRVASAYRRMVPMYSLLGEISDGLKAARAASELLKQLETTNLDPRSLAAEVGRNAFHVSEIYHHQNALAMAEDSAREAIRALTKAAGRDGDSDVTIVLAKAHRQLGRTLVDMGKLEDAQRAYLAAAEIVRSKQTRDGLIARDVELCLTELALGLVYVRMGRLDDAVPRYLAAIEAADVIVAESRERIDLRRYRASAFLNLGIAYSHQEKHDDALVAKTRACDEYRQLVQSFPDSLRCHEDLCAALASKGRTLRDVDRLEEASATLGEAIQIGQLALGQFQDSTKLLEELTTASASLSTVLIDRDLPDESKQAALQGIAFGDRLLAQGATAADCRYAYSRVIRALAAVFARDGRHADVIHELEKGLDDAVAAQQTIPSSPAYRGNLLWYYAESGVSYCALGRHQEALASIRAVAAMYSETSASWCHAAILAVRCRDQLKTAAADGDEMASAEADYLAEAFRCLERARGLGASPQELAEVTEFKPLVTDPHWQKLMAESRQE